METNTILLITLGLIFILFIIACALLYTNAKNNLPYVNSLYTKQSSERASYWKVVNGTILESTLDYRDHKGIFRGSKRQYRPRITYEYLAHDRKHVHSLPLMNWTHNKKEALRTLDKHQAEGNIIVRFHPKQPETSIIELNI